MKTRNRKNNLPATTFILILLYNGLLFGQGSFYESITTNSYKPKENIETSFGIFNYTVELCKREDSIKKANINRYLKDLDVKIAETETKKGKKEIIKHKKDYLKLIEILDRQRKKINELYLPQAKLSNQNDSDRLIWLYNYIRFEISICINFEKYIEYDKTINIEDKY